MSSSLDAGYYAEQLRKADTEKCNLSPTKKHIWKTEGTWPSVCYVCRYCQQREYTK